MGFIRKNKGSLVRLDSTLYVGEKGYLFWDIDTGCVKLSDGITPGGVDACSGTGVPLLPPGGTTGQHLAKINNNDYETEWVDDAGGVPIIPDTPVPPNPTTIEVIDEVIASENSGIKWIYTLKDNNTGAVLTAEILANHHNGANIQFSRSSIIGARIRHSVDVVVDVVNDLLQLVITNLSPDTFVVTVARIKITN